MSIITLLTDFGTKDEYVGVMKGVILSRNPNAVIVDISHQIDPQGIFQAAQMIKAAYGYFPPGTVHIVVVDPGVGSRRRIVALEFGGHRFLAPDNGVLSAVLAAGEPAMIVSVESSGLFLHPVSRTFHGRDIFAPVGAALSMVHYQNPKLVVGCIPVWVDKILLCQRSIEPCYGLWTLPAGYLENGESVTQGAIREAYEEARANLTDLEPYALYDICSINQIYLFFRARLSDLDFKSGTESQDVQLFGQSEIPWDQIAFPVVDRTLRQYFKDSQSGRFPFHTGEIRRKLTNYR